MERASEILPAIVKPEHRPLTPIQERLLSFSDEENSILYQHSVLCQCSIPYRDPGDSVKLWSRRNGIIHLELQAGRVLDPITEDFIDVGLPFGPKPRLVLYHLNAEALRTRSPFIDLEDSLTAFVKRTLKLDVGGRTIRSVKQQLNRLAAADFRLGATQDGRAVTIKGTVIEGLELWTPRDPRQKVLWPTTVQFSQRYFDSLMLHAVPLKESAIARLSHTSMGLDTYTWLAQRLHRINPKKPAFVPWPNLKDQFGADYRRLVDFRRVFSRTLAQVKIVYREARFAVDGKGMRLLNSPPPVARLIVGP